jgi:16S rRNA (guanine527-N7)-methyltransferase
MLQAGGHILGVNLDESQLYQFQLYLLHLKKWNEHINLTGLKDEKDIVIKHFLDSLTLAHFLKPAWYVLDIGSGAGVPGLVLKIALPSLVLTMVEAREKKVAFLKEIRRLLNLKDVVIIKSYLKPNCSTLFKQKFDAVLGRAVMPMPKYIRLALSFIKEDGLILSMLGKRNIKEDLVDICQKYSVFIAEQKGFLLPFSNFKREILAFKKLNKD